MTKNMTLRSDYEKGANTKGKIAEVCSSLKEWKRVIKFEEDSIASPICEIRVEENGFFVEYKSQDFEGYVIDISRVVEVRTDKPPQDQKMIEHCNHVAGDSSLVSERCFTIVTADNFTTNSFYNFVALSTKDCKTFVEGLRKLIINQFYNANLSQMDFVRKMYTKLLLSAKDVKNISVKEISRATAKDEKKRVTEALKNAGMKHNDGKIAKEKFTFEAFYKFYREMLGDRPEIAKAFDEIKGSKSRNYVTVDQMVEFLNKFQRDPRLNEILFPHHNKDGTKKLIKTYESDKSKQKIGQLTLEGFTSYLMSPDCLTTNINNLPEYMDMNMPLSHYFINSSHNTYLTGDQFGSKSTVEIYRQCLLQGCRCIELDCWDGEDNEPIITHGFTLCSSIHFKEVLLAINDTAFVNSCYPLILSFENHCTPRQQQKMANYCVEIFGSKLLQDTLDDAKAQLRPGLMLPSPNMLKYKILVKNKKRREDMPDMVDKNEKPEEEPTSLAGTGIYLDGVEPPNDNVEDADNNKGNEKPTSWEEREEEAEVSLSKLVNYIMPATKFRGFEAAGKKNVSYEMSSFVETTALNHLKEHPVEFVNYNKRQLSRIYPKGARVASDNYQPQMFWNTGCQMVALNYQTLDMPMQLNIGKFEFNNKCGYLLKPDFMTKKQSTFNPFLEMSVEGVVAAELRVHVLSGQFLSEKKCGVKVELEMYGIANDSVRRKHQTKTIMNSVCPRWDSEPPFVFPKIVIPDLAMMRFIVNDDAGKQIGQRIIPMESIQSGYRFISLRNEFNQPIGMSSLFVKIEVKDYIPSELADFANALVDPIAHLSKDDLMRRREDMLTTLVDADDLVDPEAQEKRAAEEKAAAEASEAGVKQPRRVRRVRGRPPVEGESRAAPAPVGPPKQAAIMINGLENFVNNNPLAGAVPTNEVKPTEEFVAGGLYVGDDSAKLVKDENAGKPKSTAPILPWDLPVEDVPNEDERQLPTIPGIDWGEVTEEGIKRGKTWQKYHVEQDKKRTKLVKNLEKEREMLEQAHRAKMKSGLKDQKNAVDKLKKPRKRGSTKGAEEESKEMKAMEDAHTKERENLDKQLNLEQLKVQRIHKSELSTNDRKAMKEGHEAFKKARQESQSEQMCKFETGQTNEKNELRRTLEGKKATALATTPAGEVEEKKVKIDKQIESELKKLGQKQEIRLEQVKSAHREMLKDCDKLYIKRLKDFDETLQHDVETLEKEIEKIGFVEI